MTKILLTWIKTFLFLILLIAPIVAQNPNIKTEYKLHKESYALGDTLVIGIKVFIPDSFHLYSNPLGPGIGKPLTLTLPNSSGITWIKSYKSAPTRCEPEFGDFVYAFSDSAFIYIQGILLQEPKTCTLTISGLMCNTACIPVSKNCIVSIPFSNATKNSDTFKATSKQNWVNKLLNADSLPFTVSENKNFLTKTSIGPINLSSLKTSLSEPPPASLQLPTFSPKSNNASMSIYLALFLAFVAGIILNAMPCVLPVLGIKVMSLAGNTHKPLSSKILRSSLFFAGVMTVFLILATFAAFAKLSWGAQFQNPVFLIALISIMILFGLGMFDVYIIGVPSVVGKASLKQSDTLKGYFFRGILTTLLATPCSGPFLGAVLSYAITQPPLTTYLVFSSLGFGMSFPYLLLSLATPLTRFIPKPGPWMDHLKVILGFSLFAFAAYLLGGLPNQLGVQTAGFSIFLIASVFLFNKIAPFGATAPRKLIAWAISIVILIIGVQLWFGLLTNIGHSSLSSNKQNSIVWEPYTVNKFLNATKEQKHIIVDFTATWCMNCQYNSAAVLSDPKIANLIQSKNVVTLLADITQNNPPAETLLTKLGSRSIPFFALFPANNPTQPIVMPDILTKEKVITALENLK